MKSDNLKTVFVHIPKCGGTSIEAILFELTERTPENFWKGHVDNFQDKYWEVWEAFSRMALRNRAHMVPFVNRYQTDGLQHLTALQMRHAMGRGTFETYYRFAVVRHPVKRSLSQYHHMRRWPEFMQVIGMTAEDSFVDYLRKTYRRAHVHWLPQISFVNDRLGNCLVNDVVKLEEINVGMQTVFEKIGIPKCEIPLLNSYTHSNKKHELTCEEKALIWELYKEDLEEFHYDIETF